jgi:hypothetical protein
MVFLFDLRIILIIISNIYFENCLIALCWVKKARILLYKLVVDSTDQDISENKFHSIERKVGELCSAILTKNIMHLESISKFNTSDKCLGRTYFIISIANYQCDYFVWGFEVSVTLKIDVAQIQKMEIET